MAFAAGPRGIYYAGCEPRSDPPVYLLNPATGKQRLLGQLEKLTQSVPDCWTWRIARRHAQFFTLAMSATAPI